MRNETRQMRRQRERQETRSHDRGQPHERPHLHIRTGAIEELSPQESEAVAIIASPHIAVSRRCSPLHPLSRSAAVAAATELIRLNNAHYGLGPMCAVMMFGEECVPFPIFDTGTTGSAILLQALLGLLDGVCAEAGQRPAACAIAALPEVFPNDCPAVVFAATADGFNHFARLRSRDDGSDRAFLECRVTDEIESVVLEVCRRAVGQPTPLNEFIPLSPIAPMP